MHTLHPIMPDHHYFPWVFWNSRPSPPTHWFTTYGPQHVRCCRPSFGHVWNLYDMETKKKCIRNIPPYETEALKLCQTHQSRVSSFKRQKEREELRKPALKEEWWKCCVFRPVADSFFFCCLFWCGCSYLDEWNKPTHTRAHTRTALWYKHLTRCFWSPFIDVYFNPSTFPFFFFFITSTPTTK